MTNYDVVTLGESMLRFTPSHGLRWEQAEQFQIHIGGSESNTAVGLARLGHRVAWISRLTDNPLGRKIAGSIRYHGVDVQHIVWTDQDRIGTYYYEEGSAPRGNQVIYDRSDSSFANFCGEDLPSHLFQPGQSRWLHVTGISLGLGKVARELILQAIQLAKSAGWKISFDLNYRAKLWQPHQAVQVCEPVMNQADLVFLPMRDLQLLWGIECTVQQLSKDPRAAALQAAIRLRQRISSATLVMTLASVGACCLRGDQFILAETSPVPQVGRLGGGDAFSAGFLSSLLTEPDDLHAALCWGNAAAQLKYSIAGDMPYFSRAEVERCVRGQFQGQLNR